MWIMIKNEVCVSKAKHISIEKNIKISEVCIKGEDNITHHPHHILEWDIPPGVFHSMMV